MKLSPKHVAGATLRQLETDQRLPCPKCGKALTQTRTKFETYHEAEGNDFQTVSRGFKCKCGYRNKSVEWRPLGEKHCCDVTIKNRVTAPMSSVITKIEGFKLWERERSALCACGNTYHWLERMILGTSS